MVSKYIARYMKHLNICTFDGNTILSDLFIAGFGKLNIATHAMLHISIPDVFVQALFYKKYSIKSDVWSFGCVMYEIWSLGYKPFEDIDGREVHSYLDFYYHHNSIAMLTVAT